MFLPPTDSGGYRDKMNDLDWQEISKRLITFEEVEKDVFRSPNRETTRQVLPEISSDGVVVAQALFAAEQTVTEKLKPNAIHSMFLGEVNPTLPVDYHVSRLRDGRSFANRTVEAKKNGEIVMILQASFHIVEEGALFHQDPIPDVPHRSEFRSMEELVPEMLELVKKGRMQVPKLIAKALTVQDLPATGDKDLFEFRPTSAGHHFLFHAPPKDMTFYYWVRARKELPNDERLHRFILTFLTDAAYLNDSVYKPHIYSGKIERFSESIPIDHSVWFHHSDVKADEWMLFETRSEIAHGNRGLARGRLWTEDGKLVLSCAQEFYAKAEKGISRL